MEKQTIMSSSLSRYSLDHMDVFIHLILIHFRVVPARHEAHDQDVGP